MQAFFSAHPEVDVVFGNYIVADRQGRPLALRREIPFRSVYVANGFLNAQSCTLFFRRRLFDQGRLKLNSRLRYAADKELLLKLAAAGTVIRHLPDYLAIFGVDGTNLSTHPRAREESEQVRAAYGAFRSQALRRLVLAFRRFERLLRGGYRFDPISYLYAVDDVPRYVEYSVAKLGGRYSLSETEGRADRVRAVGP